jgi:hypothetical protein
MSNECNIIHRLANNIKRYYFPFEKNDLPQNGIYFLFEKGEISHNLDRIVRVGTHTGNNQLIPRLKQHFLHENKDRSIFRKNIGRAILKKNNDPYLKFWEIDLTTRKAKDEYLHLIDLDYQKKIEKIVSSYIQNNFSFSVIEIETKEERLKIESKIISTISWCNECKKSNNWLGNSSPKKKITESGLWLVNELYKTAFDSDSIKYFESFFKS